MTQQTDAWDWSGYNAQRDRPVRPLAVRAHEIAPGGEGRVAVELGSGAGIEAAYLARAGWQVHTFDSDPSVADAMLALEEELLIQHTMMPLEELSDLPTCDLILACASLPFLPRPAFDRLWGMMTKRLRPGGVLAVDLFGDRDDWARRPGTFLTRDEVDERLQGFDVVALTEREFDGQAYSGPKHWHAYQVLARQPDLPGPHERWVW